MACTQYPAHKKMNDCIDEIRAILDFVESSAVIDIQIADGQSVSDAVYDHYGLDPMALEKERREMLAALDAAQQGDG